MSERKELPIDAQWSRTKSFTRRSRALPANLERTVARDGHNFIVEVERGIGQTTISSDFVFDQQKAFGRSAPLIVEVGSGTGDQIVAAASQNPQNDYLALEVWQPGIAKMISRAVQSDITNLRVIEADAAQALPILFGPETVTELWTFFPDPWRKARHRKRRLVSHSFAEKVATILRAGSYWRMATDWDDYAWQMRDVLEGCSLFENPFSGQNPDPNDPEPERGGFATRFEERVLTRFENRGVEAGRNIHDILGVKKSSNDVSNSVLSMSID